MSKYKNKLIYLITTLIILINPIILIIFLFNNQSGCSWEATKMSDMELAMFNSKFTQYEGIRRFSDVKNLIDIVNANNASSIEHGYDLLISINGNKISGNISEGYNFNGNTSERYKIVINLEDGLVTSINILEFDKEN